MTLDRIVRRNALRYPDKPALVIGASSCTWRELDGRVDRVANALRARGLARGDRVALLLGNCAEFIELYFGLARAGMIAVPVNYRLTPGELAQLLGHATPSLFVVGAAFADKANDVAGLLPELTRRRWIVGDAMLPGDEAYVDVVAAASRAIPKSIR